MTFKQVLQNINIRMSEKYTEYLIYIMKKNKEELNMLKLEELRYLNVLEMLDVESENILNDISSSLEDNELNNLNDNDEELDEPNIDGELILDLNEEAIENIQNKNNKSYSNNEVIKNNYENKGM